MPRVTLTPIKFIHLTKKNRRVTVTFCQDENGEFSVMIETKRLLDFKKRHILESKLYLGIESFEGLGDAFDLVRNDPEYKKLTNAERHQYRKDKFQAITNIEI